MVSRLCFIGHSLIENRSGLIVDARLTRVSGHAERLAPLEMIKPWADRPRAVTLGADRGYDAADFVEELRTLNVHPHVSQNTSRRLRRMSAVLQSEVRPPSVHLISASTGETLNAVARAALARFSRAAPEVHVAVLVRTDAEMAAAIEAVRRHPGAVLYTIADPGRRAQLLDACRALGVTATAVLDPVIAALAEHLGELPSERAGLQHRVSSEYRSAIDRRTTRHPGYAASQRARKRIEEAFGSMKTIAGLRQTKLRGLAKVDWAFNFVAAAYKLVRLPMLMASA